MENEHSELIIGYLQGRLQGRSLDDFYAWVNESADNKKLFFETKALYEACAPSRGASEIHDSWLRLLDKRKSRQRKRYSLLTRISTYAAVAMFAAAITSTVFIFSSREYDDRITSYVSGDGLEADVVVLPDGTRVSLGTRTSFSYDSRYGKSERIVQLEGEAYFEVAKDKEKPFIVKANGINVQALGTSFNIRAHKDDKSVAIILISGKVKVDDGRHEAYMKPNERLVCNLTNGQFEKSELHPNASNLLWRSNELALYGESFEEICTMLTRMYNCKFIFKNEKAKQYTYHGIIKNGSLNNVLEYISQAGGINYKIESDNTIIIY